MEDEIEKNRIKEINEDFKISEIIDKENGSVNERKIVSILGEILIIYNK